MPAILSHHLFGRAFLARQDNRPFMTRDTRDAFLLGNQGPDPLFFATRTPLLVNTKILGTHMHHEKIEEYLETWRNRLNSLSSKDHAVDVLQAYVDGVLCHYSLDRAAHPLVLAYVEAICSAGIKGLGPGDASFVHGQIESDLDMYLLYRLTGLTLEEYRIPKQVLYSSDRVLSSIDSLYMAAAELYGARVPHNVFTISVKDMRLTQNLLYSPGGTKRIMLGYAERLVRRHSLLQALSHSPEAHDAVWYANEEKRSWRNPATGEESNQSFSELFEEALNTVFTVTELFHSGAPMTELTHGLDFFGAPERVSEPVGERLDEKDVKGEKDVKD